MKILNKSEQKEIYVNLLKEQLEQARMLLKESGVSFSLPEQKKSRNIVIACV